MKNLNRRVQKKMEYLNLAITTTQDPGRDPVSEWESPTHIDTDTHSQIKRNNRMKEKG